MAVHSVCPFSMHHSWVIYFMLFIESKLTFENIYEYIYEYDSQKIKVKLLLTLNVNDWAYF